MHAGGRMSTNRQEVNGATVRADMGAQLLVLRYSLPSLTFFSRLLYHPFAFVGSRMIYVDSALATEVFVSR